MRNELRYDAVVIGAGVAGLVAATRLAQGGARVCVLAKGVGCTHLAPGTIDVLGYVDGERVQEPLAALARLAGDHPYSLLGAGAVSESLRWFSGTVDEGPLPGYRYLGGPERNLLLATALGALRPSALVPETMVAGDASGVRSLAVVGSRELRDFHASLCATNLRAAGIEARAVDAELETDRADANTLDLARRFDEPGWRARFCARLSPLLGDAEHVGLPAMLGLRDPHGVHADVERRLGRRVFEIPTLPPSVPGMRLYEILTAALRKAGGRLVLGGEVVAARRDGDGRVLAVAT
ncbi:MAG: FAD-binding protein, partial [Solirubrobacteraceae bacterium]